MISFFESLVFQLENTLYCGVIILLSILIGGEKDRWYAIVDENSPFRNPYFLVFMAYIWLIGCPWLGWYFQKKPHGFWEPLYQINPYMAWMVRIAASIVLILCSYYYKRRIKRNTLD